MSDDTELGDARAAVAQGIAELLALSVNVDAHRRLAGCRARRTTRTLFAGKA